MSETKLETEIADGSLGIGAERRAFDQMRLVFRQMLDAGSEMAMTLEAIELLIDEGRFASACLKAREAWKKAKIALMSLVPPDFSLAAHVPALEILATGAQYDRCVGSKYIETSLTCIESGIDPANRCPYCFAVGIRPAGHPPPAQPAAEGKAPLIDTRTDLHPHDCSCQECDPITAEDIAPPGQFRMPAAPAAPTNRHDPLRLRGKGTSMTSGLEKYRMPDTPYWRYHSVFVRNIQDRHKFRITLITGESDEGIPTCVGFEEKDQSFLFQVGQDYYRIPFKDLATAAWTT